MGTWSPEAPKLRVHMNVVPRSTMKKMVEQRMNSEV